MYHFQEDSLLPMVEEQQFSGKFVANGRRSTILRKVFDYLSRQQSTRVDSFSLLSQLPPSFWIFSFIYLIYFLERGVVERI
jgi:hypothetical protein